MGVKIEILKKIQNNNTLTINLNFMFDKSNQSRLAYSEEFKINTVVLKIMLQQIADYGAQYFVKFNSEEEHEELIYIIKYSDQLIEDEKVGEQHRTLMSNCNEWCLINSLDFKNEYSKEYRISIDISELTRLTSNFSTLHDDTELTDFELCADGGSIHLHKSIAASFSPVLRKMFEGSWKEELEGIVQAQNTSKTTLQHMKDYMYLGRTPDTNSDIKQLLLLASFYLMPNLEKLCINKLMRRATEENVYDLMSFVVANDYPQLLLKILDRVKNGSLIVDKIAGHCS